MTPVKWWETSERDGQLPCIHSWEWNGNVWMCTQCFMRKDEAYGWWEYSEGKKRLVREYMRQRAEAWEVGMESKEGI